MSESPQFHNSDNKLIWQELKHIGEKLDKLNGAVSQNTEYRVKAQERWENHKDEHDAVKRNSFIADVITGIASAIVAVTGIHIKGGSP